MSDQAAAPADALVQALLDLFGPLRLRYCPLTPTPRQEAFLLLRDQEVFFGGAAGGGKSVALLMAALQYADVPGYHALLVRPSLTELALPGGMIDLSHTWLPNSPGKWDGDLKLWRFPGPGRRSSAGGASVGFGYLTDDNDLGRYAGTSYSYLGFDELTRFSEPQYRRMFRALRQPATTRANATATGSELADVPTRVRAASNPGGAGHQWVKSRFVDPSSRHPTAVFVPSRLSDNPHLDQQPYIAALHELPPAERERLLHGDWEIPDEGELFQRDWFPIIEPHQLPVPTKAVRYWDLAGTEPNVGNSDPDYTVGLRLELHAESGHYYITDIVRTRKAPGAIENLVAATAERDGHTVPITLEQEPGAAGKAVADRYNRHVLRGYTVRSRRVTGTKEIRARPVAAAAENGLICIVRSQHHNDFLDELTAFPHGRHDDCVDALSGAHRELSRTQGTATGTTHVPRGRIPMHRFTPLAQHGWLQDSHDPIAELAARLGAHPPSPRP